LETVNSKRIHDAFMKKNTIDSRIIAIVNRIPRGKVATYGQVARLAGMPGHARLTGYALHRLPDGSKVPWHRVVNAKGGISLGADSFAGSLQRALLESEGVAFNIRNAIPLNRYQWKK
jgi:methylated-DNA-protein-cysteine methyltransferase related protein